MAPSNVLKRTCKEICKKYKMIRPPDGNRYASGQGHCQICNTWIDHNGCHMKDGSPALQNSVGWFCNCCNYRVRQKPRNKVYKEKLRNNKSKNPDFFNTEQEDVLTSIPKSTNKTDFFEIRKELFRMLKEDDEDLKLFKNIEKHLSAIHPNELRKILDELKN